MEVFRQFGMRRSEWIFIQVRGEGGVKDCFFDSVDGGIERIGCLEPAGGFYSAGISIPLVPSSTTDLKPYETVCTLPSSPPFHDYGGKTK